MSLLIIHLSILYYRYTHQSVNQDMYDFMTMHDHLTQLPNRQYLNQYLYKQAPKKNIAFLHINLDRFKLINNVFGHQQADILLNLIAQRLNTLMQEKTLLFRIAGDELLFVIEDHHTQHTEQWAEKIIKALSRPFKIEDKNIYITCSIGIAISPQHGKTLQELLIHADTAMSQAKKQGRNNYHLYNPQLCYDIEHLNQQILNDLYTAHQNQQLVLHYQAKFDVSTLHISGIEALLRWQHPQHGLLYPKDFINIAEKTGNIIPMTYWVLEESCRQVQLWRQQGLEHLLPISINISGLVFEQKKLLHYTELFIQRYQLQKHDLMFEITESTAMKNLQLSQKKCRKLQQLGVKISIDDFGVGYSNFMYLKELCIDELKIDRQFIHNIEYIEKNRIILKHMIDLAQQLDLIATVEGVENQVQLDILKQFNCPKAQGFFLAKPMPIDKLEQTFKKTAE
ncbi:bifunctional diguanylate cyclase/phosphodiesterase [Moraxella sp. ZY210820]|nr:bifunctional diguanylate cyclase/phosphodiesterase [Moraxella sp. ZY210820]WLF83058.1 bifunctional diguanylate cyclase/phosphodiesterase [Moraxella sp. ZY210820]